MFGKTGITIDPFKLGNTNLRHNKKRAHKRNVKNTPKIGSFDLLFFIFLSKSAGVVVLKTAGTTNAGAQLRDREWICPELWMLSG